MLNRFKEIYNYRDMIWSLVKRELRGRYQKSVLGMVWTLLNPLFQILVYTIVFTFIFPSGIENYYLYLMIGMMPWTFFSESLGQGAGSIISNSDMTKKIYFPREVLPIASVTAKFVNLLLAFVVVFGFIFVSGNGVSVSLILFPVILVLEYFIALGLALMFSSITVYLRDMEYIVGVMLMAWIWGTPVMYSIDNLPAFIRNILLINPMYSIIVSYHDVLFYKVFPPIAIVAVAFLFAVLLFFIGEYVFLKLEGDFAEEL